MSAERRDVTLRGRRLEVLRSSPARPAPCTLVFLHEGLGSATLWREWPWELAEQAGAAALVYSRYGHGDSDVLSEARDPRFMHQEAAVLGELLRACGLRAPVLVGHSDGASIALLHAAAHPGVRGLVLLAPHLFVEEHGLAGIRAAREAFAATDLALRLGRHHRDPLRTFRGWNDVWLAAGFRDWDIRDAAAHVRCPILAIQGGDDAYGTFAQLDELAARAGAPVAQLRLSRCGHSPHREREAAVRAAILTFLGELPGAARPGG